MSKRGTDNQLTKDNYDQEDQDSGSQMGTFKMASSDELARRPMKALRRLGSRTSSNLSDDGKRASPTGAQSSSLIISSSSSPSLQPTPSSSNPFAAFSFGNTQAKSAKASTESTPAGPYSSQASKGKFTSVASADTTDKSQENPTPATTSNTTATTTKTTTAPVVSLSSSILAKGAFTFNIGSNANTLAITTPTPVPAAPVSIDREGYERSLRGVNQGFLKRIQRDLEHNATANLAGAFDAYIEHRKKVRKQYPGIKEPETIVMRQTSANVTGDNVPAKSTFSGFGAYAAMGDTTSTTPKPIQAAPSTSSPFASLGSSAMFGFGSSSIKGAIDPPRNPTSSATWSNTGTNGSPSSFSPFSNLVPFSTSNNAPFSPNMSNAFSSSSSSTTATRPFSFPPPKPFTFGRTGSDLSSSSASSVSEIAAAGLGPKPFVFRTPSTPWTTTNAESSRSSTTTTTTTITGTSPNGNHQERVVADDTKSELADSREGEEGERTVYEVRAKLFGLEDGEHKDLGVGQFRVNEHTESGKRRMIMRTGGTGLITLNSWVIQGMPPQRLRNVLTIFAIEGGKPRRFMLRVKEEHAAHELLMALEAGQTTAST
ncbi:hypothetical protein BGX29_005608 [Mortierella sp. GBA35]|nr:hypothetical protein BGX29_005608 [Mortierella sp. GBA35]